MANRCCCAPRWCTPTMNCYQPWIMTGDPVYFWDGGANPYRFNWFSQQADSNYNGIRVNQILKFNASYSYQRTNKTRGVYPYIEYCTDNEPKIPNQLPFFPYFFETSYLASIFNTFHERISDRDNPYFPVTGKYTLSPDLGYGNRGYPIANASTYKDFLLNPGIYKVTYKNMSNISLFPITQCKIYLAQYSYGLVPFYARKMYCSENLFWINYTTFVQSYGLYAVNSRNIFDGPKNRYLLAYNKYWNNNKDANCTSSYPRHYIAQHESTTSYDIRGQSLNLYNGIGGYYSTAFHTGDTGFSGEVLVEIKTRRMFRLRASPVFLYPINIETKNGFVDAMELNAPKGMSTESVVYITGDGIECQDTNFISTLATPTKYYPCGPSLFIE